jgi:hypothetical protein
MRGYESEEEEDETDSEGEEQYPSVEENVASQGGEGSSSVAIAPEIGWGTSQSPPLSAFSAAPSSPSSGWVPTYTPSELLACENGVTQNNEESTQSGKGAHVAFFIPGTSAVFKSSEGIANEFKGFCNLHDAQTYLDPSLQNEHYS